MEGSRKRVLEDNTHSIKCKFQRSGRRVRFSSNEERAIGNFFQDMSETEAHALRSKLWYSNRDTECFMRERVETIRLLRAVSGKADLLEPTYCVRGFENFKSDALSSSLHQLRLQYVETVLSLQEKESSPEIIAQASIPRSNQAVHRARLRALQDAISAQAYHQEHCVTKENFNERAFDNTTLSGLRMDGFKGSLAEYSGSSVVAMQHILPKSHGASAASRKSLEQFSLMKQGRRALVDVVKLKEMNRKVLQGLGGTLKLSNNNPSLPKRSTLDLLNEALQATAS